MVLFSSKAEAQACARDQDGKGLGESMKVAIQDNLTTSIEIYFNVRFFFNFR